MNDAPQFLKRLKSITLSSNEHLALRERLAAYADAHPATEAGSVASPYTTFFAVFSSRRFSMYAFVLMLVVLGGGGVTLASENSVPGDAFYALKIHVNEPLMTVFATTDAGQAQVAARLATRRADEAVLLASKGELTDEKQAYLAKAFTSEIEKTAQRTQTLAQSGDVTSAATVKADLAANLAGEAQALGAITNESNTKAREFLSVIVATSDTLDDSADNGTVLATTDGSPTPTVGVTSEQPTPQKTTRIGFFAKGMASSTLATTTRTTTHPQLSGRFGHRLLLTATTTLNARLETNALSVPVVHVDSIMPPLPTSILPPGVESDHGDGMEGLTK